MKNLLIALVLILSNNFVFSQNPNGANELVDIGINYHDKGDYDGAIGKYDEALKLDKDNFRALAEKAYSLVSSEKFQKAVECSQKAIQLYPDGVDLASVYVTLGNAYDGLLKTDKSIEIYDEGIKLFPDYFMLYFNKGVTLSSVKRYKEAINSFEKSVQINSKHASSHNALARILFLNGEKIPSLLAYCRFLALEQQTKRASENLQSVNEILKGTAKKTGKNSVSISLDPAKLKDSTETTENNFRSTELILMLSGALDFEKKNKNKSEIELFTDKLKTVCASLSELKENNSGFYWNYYAPYFISMKENNLVETFVHIAFAASDDSNNKKWLDKHKKEVSDFFFWSKTFDWKK